MQVHVECYAGHRGEETPRAFVVGVRPVSVVAVIDAWLAPDHRYFKVKGDDGGVYILRHDSAGTTWELTVFQAIDSPHRG